MSKQELAIRPRKKPITRGQMATVSDRMDELGFDPLKQAIAIATGGADGVLTVNHPLLPLLQSWCDECILDLETDQALLLERSRYDNLLYMGRKFLTDSWVNHDLRYKSPMDLLNYQHSKVKAVEIERVDERGGESKEVAPLTRADVELFRDVFDAAY